MAIAHSWACTHSHAGVRQPVYAGYCEKISSPSEAARPKHLARKGPPYEPRPPPPTQLQQMGLEPSHPLPQQWQELMELMWQYTCLQHANGPVTHWSAMQPGQLARVAAAGLCYKQKGIWRVQNPHNSARLSQVQQHLCTTEPAQITQAAGREVGSQI